MPKYIPLLGMSRPLLGTLKLLPDFRPNGFRYLALFLNLLKNTPSLRGKKRLLTTGTEHFWTSLVGVTASFDWASESESRLSHALSETAKNF